jgi:hypothetical protein
VPAARVDLTRHEDRPIEQGAAFDLSLRYEVGGSPVDLSNGWEAKAEVRQDYSAESVEISFVSSGLTGGEGTIMLDANGGIAVHADPDATAGLTPGGAWWDLLLVPSTGQTKRLVEGKVEITPRVTRE